jgi:hypothetical protein
VDEHLSTAWNRYRSATEAAGPEGIQESAKADSIDPRLIMLQDHRYTVAFAPFKDPACLRRELASAVVLFVGLTPGRHQARLAIAESLKSATSQDNVVAFAGTMRSNLVKMLDMVGLPQAIGIDGTAQLFKESHGSLATSTSLLRFPVFKGRDQANFSGSAAAVRRHPFLMRMVDELFSPMLDVLDHSCLIIPMGKTVEAFCSNLAHSNPHAVVLRGFPHPSGGNGHRVRIFRENEASLTGQIAEFKRICSM